MEDPRLSYLEKSVMTLLILISHLTLGQIKWVFKDKEKRTQFSEIFVLLRLVALIFLVFFPFDSLLFFVIVVYILIGVFNYPLYIIFVEVYGEDWSPRSLNRSLMLLLINYIEILIGFAALYLYTGTIGDMCRVPISKSLDAIYFSSITITTLGYGDFTPLNGKGRMLVSVEAIAGMIFTVLIIAIFVGLKQRRKSERKTKDVVD